MKSGCQRVGFWVCRVWLVVPYLQEVEIEVLVSKGKSWGHVRLVWCCSRDSKLKSWYQKAGGFGFVRLVWCCRLRAYRD